MREIKFRAWDKRVGIMHDVARMVLHAAEMCVEEIWVLSDGELCTSTHPLRHHECKLMQFTGVLDKSGKEIYEGDIMKYPTSNIPQNFGIVLFEEGKFWLREKWKDEFPKAEGMDIAISIYWEIIGNIYENPGLLNDRP